MSYKQRDPKTGRFVETGTSELSVTYQDVVDSHNAANVHEALNEHAYYDLITESLKQSVYRQSIEITNLQSVIKTKDDLLEDRRKLIDSRNTVIDEVNAELKLSVRDMRICAWSAVLLFCAVVWLWVGIKIGMIVPLFDYVRGMK